VVLWSLCDRSGLLAEHALWSASLTSSTECADVYWNAAKPGKPPLLLILVHAPLPTDITRTCCIDSIGDYCIVYMYLNPMASFIWHVQSVSPMANGLPLAQAV